MTKVDMYVQKPRTCFACTFYPKYDVGRYLAPVRVSCRHTRFSVLVDCKLSKPSIVLSVLASLSLLSSLLTYFSVLSNLCKSQDKILCLINLVDGISLASTFIISNFIFWQMNLQLNEVNTWSIFYQRQFYIDERVPLYKCLIASLGAILVLTLGVFHFGFPYDNSPWNLLRKIAIVVCYTIHCYGAIDIYIKIKIVEILLLSTQENLKRTLPKTTNLETKFGTYTNLISGIHANISTLMGYMGTAFPLWSVISVTSLIFNIYIWLQLENHHTLALTALQIRTLATIA
ncbi:hypothetical protein Zmor_008207 [Zophobas morio]|uniref:Uncharacterized protein n=1 Tax=Zophobas morio TaxID=2755281 RepID=A0AA38IXD5_9CUCU|nr:hypothetical protein Zmor_008207 [Zophobas morio]